MAALTVQSRFCPGCSYDLRGSSDTCPECGRRFDPADPGTYRTRPARWWTHWPARIAVAIVLLASLYAGMVGWLWLGYREEQKALVALGAQVVSANPSDALSPKLLPPPLRYLNVRVDQLWTRDGTTEADLLHIARFSRAKAIILNNSALPELKGLAGMTRLQVLYLNNSPVTDEGLASLAGMTELRTLSLNDTDVTDAGLAHLAGMHEMLRLGLRNTRITDVGLAYLAGMTHLKALDVGNTRVTDAGLAHLAGMPQLQELRVDSTQVTDAGVNTLNHSGALR